MGKPVLSNNVKRGETMALNTKVNKEVFNKFKDYCAYHGYPMNILIETFMRQYANNNFEINHYDIMKWKNDKSEIEILNTTFNKEVYLDFKSKCKNNNYFVKYVIVAFMEKFIKENFIMEFVKEEGK